MRNVLATMAGFIVASLTVFIFESLIGHNLFPLPESINPMNMDSIKENMHLIPVGAKIFVVIAHFSGIVVGMFVAGLISKTSMIPSYIVGISMLAATTFNLIVLPKEIWFLLADSLFAIVGFFIGKNLANKKVIEQA